MRISTRELCLLAIGAALMFVLQIVMAPLPNIEPASLFVIVLTCAFGAKALISIAVFILLEGLLYGFGLWWFFYLYAWPVLVMTVLLLKPFLHDSAWGWALISGAFGLCFGLLYALMFLFTGGVQAFFAAWISGLPFDITHCVANFVLCLVLYKPLMRIVNFSAQH